MTIPIKGVVSNVGNYEQAIDEFMLSSFYEGLLLPIIEAQVCGFLCFTAEETVSKESSVTE